MLAMRNTLMGLLSIAFHGGGGDMDHDGHAHHNHDHDHNHDWIRLVDGGRQMIFDVDDVAENDSDDQADEHEDRVFDMMNLPLEMQEAVLCYMDRKSVSRFVMVIIMQIEYVIFFPPHPFLIKASKGTNTLGRCPVLRAKWLVKQFGVRRAISASLKWRSLISPPSLEYLFKVSDPIPR
jgi:hypothetical protein